MTERQARASHAVEEDAVDYLPPSEQPEPLPQSPQPRRKATGAIGTILAAVLAFALKFKVLLIGLKLLAPMWTFALSLWVYVAVFGWRLAIVVMGVLLAHELGHYFAFRAYGLPARLPAFVPLLGAFTAGKTPDDPEHSAYVALAGPATGFALAAVCWAIGISAGDRFWLACADIGAFLNLFNMIPLVPFDGGRVAAAVWNSQQPTAARLRVGACYAATALGLLALLLRAHAAAGAPASM